MKKILKRFIIILIMIFCYTMNINAEEYSCHYYNQRGQHTGLWGVQIDRKFKYKVDTEKKTITSDPVDSAFNGRIDFIADTLVMPSQDEEYYVDKLEGKCQSKIYICKYISGTQTVYSALFNDSYRNTIENAEFYLESYDGKNYVFKDGNECSRFMADKGISEGNPAGSTNGACRKYHLDNKTEDCVQFSRDDSVEDQGESVDIKYTCDYFEKTKKELTSLTDEYKSCKSKNNICSHEATDHEEKLDKLKEYCKNVVSHQNYGDSCMIDCLGLNKKLKEEKLLITDTDVEVKCSATEDIIDMVYNVLKWAKYIAPALVIILSMLDFIKAIASQSDDEMKKAQGKFVKRLIVAALLFLLPFIINFMLKTFGMYNSKCDVNNLFSSSK